jgi:hypothetical protein
VSKSYTETKNKKPFNWYRFLNKQTYSHRELVLAIQKSSNWVLCAAGTQCAIIPRGANGEPTDILLSRLGVAFHQRILDMLQAIYHSPNDKSMLEWNRQAALRILDQIEERSFELLVEIADAKEHGKNRL